MHNSQYVIRYQTSSFITRTYMMPYRANIVHCAYDNTRRGLGDNYNTSIARRLHMFCMTTAHNHSERGRSHQKRGAPARDLLPIVNQIRRRRVVKKETSSVCVQRLLFSVGGAPIMRHS